MLLYLLHVLHGEFLKHTVMPPTRLYGIAIGQHRMHMAQELPPFTYGSMQWLPGEAQHHPGTNIAIADSFGNL